MSSKKNAKNSGPASAPNEKASKGSDESKDSKPSGAWTRFRENAEAVIVAIILALIIRHFSLEAFEIPTGSMAPGLHGVHIDTQCPNCDTVESIGISTDSDSGQTNVHWRGGLVYEGNCPECECKIEAIVRATSATIHCPSCRVPRPADPAGFRTPEKGFQLLTALRGIPRPSLFLLLGAVCAAMLSRGAVPRLVFGVAAVGILAFVLNDYSKGLAPKANEYTDTCRECGFRYTEVYEPSDCLGGHKILVNKFLYQVRAPSRWEVIVFKFNRQRNYIKRLIGLPGERIQVIDGDIWIGDGSKPLAVERKPEWAQDALWFKVHDSDVKERGFMPKKPWDQTGGWVASRDEVGLEFNALDSPATLRYQRPITNRNVYNGHDRTRGARAYDLRVETEVTFGGGAGTWDLHVVNGDRIFRCVLPVAGGPANGSVEPTGILVTRPSGDSVKTETLAALPELKLERDVAYTIDFYRADRHLVLRVDGEIVAETPIPDSIASNQEQDANWVAVNATGVGGTLHRVRVLRDIAYTNLDGNGNPLHLASEQPYSIPGDGYFAMGDNSSSSLDSRAWGHLSRENLLGRAFGIFWPGLPGRWEIGFIR